MYGFKMHNYVTPLRTIPPCPIQVLLCKRRPIVFASQERTPRAVDALLFHLHPCQLREDGVLTPVRFFSYIVLTMDKEMVN